MAPLTRLIVCEGPCGAPWTKRYDEVLRDKRESVKDHAIELGRRLVHTSHVMVQSEGFGLAIYQCEGCGTERRF